MHLLCDLKVIPCKKIEKKETLFSYKFQRSVHKMLETTYISSLNENLKKCVQKKYFD